MTTLLELLGFVLIVAAAAMVFVPLALLVAGLGLIAAAVALERGLVRSDSSQKPPRT